jgi:hypothetical protein
MGGCGFFFVLFIAGLFLLFRNQPGAQHEVTLVASGSAPTVMLTYTNSHGITEQQNDVHLPWRKTFTAKTGDMIVFFATNTGGLGDVTADILIDGKLVRTATSAGISSSAVGGITVP